MQEGREFDDILDECLERVLVKGETIEQCLASYPKQADELKPLLQAALATREALAIHPRPEFRAQARYQLRSALQEMEHKRGRLLFGWLPRWATALIMILAILMVGGGTVAAASGIMPDEFLYPVKLATEQVWLTLTPSASGKAEIYVKLADRRVTEIVRMANENKPEQIEQTTQRLRSCLTKIAILVAPQEKDAGVLLAPSASLEQTSVRARLRLALAHYAVSHPARLRDALKTAPESTKPALLEAIAISEDDYEKVIEALED